MINHFVQKYGINYVSQWNFESWNEPDHQIHNPFGGNNITYRQSQYVKVVPLAIFMKII